jgi:hypothetical protein
MMRVALHDDALVQDFTSNKDEKGFSIRILIRDSLSSSDDRLFADNRKHVYQLNDQGRLVDPMLRTI